MSSQNIDENSMLKHVCMCFEAWGIPYITKDILKKSQNNSEEAAPNLTHLLFDLSVLAMTDYEYSLDELGIQIDLNDQDTRQFIQEFVLSFLSEIQCPYVFRPGLQEVFFNFQESRSLLLVTAWLMVTTDFFAKIRSKLIQNKFRELYLTQSQGKKTKTNKNNKTNLSLEVDRSLEHKFKVLSQLEYKAECYEQKKQKIIKNLQKKIVKFNKINQTNHKIQSFFTKGKLDEEQLNAIRQKVGRLQFILSQRIQKMKYQQYFWIWLQLKVCDSEAKSVQNSYEEQFQWVQAKEVFKPNKPNPDYLKNYLKEYKAISDNIEKMNNQFEQIEPYLDSRTPQGSSLIQKQVKSDVKRLLALSPEEQQELGAPCFLSIELNKFLEGYGFGAKKEKKKMKAKGKKDEGCKDLLKMEINEFIDKLDGIKFI